MASSALPIGYEQQRPRINKPDMFMNTALMMERSPQAERPYGFVPMSESRREGQSGDQETTATGDAKGSGNTSAAQGGKDLSAQFLPVTQPDPEENSKETSEEEGEGQTSSKEVSEQQKPICKETTRRRTREAEPAKCNKSGAVVVLPNDRALSVDCSQEGVHAAVSALNKFGQERAKGCQVYLSRRPCSYCAKLLVQCEVAKVYYLPIEPELNDKDDVQRVDKLFKASSAGLSVFIPKVTKNVIKGVTDRSSPFLVGFDGRNEEAIKERKNKLIQEYWSEDWIRRAKEDLEWPAFDAKMQDQTKRDMEHLMEWLARATVGDVPDRNFVMIRPQSGENGEMILEEVPINVPIGDIAKQPDGNEAESTISIPDVPTPGEPRWQEHALHMVRMAQMLSQRSDDPTNPVGCILMVHGEVVAIGWNGFPAKSLYGEFPRASSADEGASRDKKEPYVIHAEQNALLTRNKRNMNDGSSILYSNKIPCGECVPLLIQAGVRNVVIPCEPNPNKPENRAFLEALKKKEGHKGRLIGYWPSRRPRDEAVERVRRDLFKEQDEASEAKKLSEN